MPPPTGIAVHDKMDDCAAKRGATNRYGLVQGEANAIAAGKRPLSSMSPKIVPRDGNRHCGASDSRRNTGPALGC